MNEKQLKNISLIISIFGIFFLTIVNDFQEEPLLEINQINHEFLGKEIKTIGVITHIKETEGLYILSLKDNNGSITGIIFKENNLTFDKTKPYEIKGKIKKYKSILEIEIDFMKTIE